MINRVTLIGNLGKDPELKTLESGAAVARFSLATSESYRDKEGNWQESTEWHEIVVWRQLAERAVAGLKKGDTIFLEGKLTSRTWQDQNGTNHRTTEVVANYFRKIIRRDSDTSNPDQKVQQGIIGAHDEFAGRMASEGPGTDDGGLPF